MTWSRVLRFGGLVLGSFTAVACLRPPPPAPPAPAPPPAAPDPAAAPAAPATPAAPGTVAAGTKLMLRMDQTIDSATTPTGSSFSATLQADLVGGDGKTVVPAQSKVFGKIVEAKASGNVVGKAELELAFTEVNIGGRMVPIESQGVKAVGEGTGRKSARQVAAGALIGGAIGGKEGAGKGAMVGGAAALMTRGNQIKIPEGTLLELQLRAPLVSGGDPTAVAAAPAAAPATAAATAPAAGTATATPAAPTAAAPAAAPAPATDAQKKECIQKLMGQGFSADEAIKSCGG